MSQVNCRTWPHLAVRVLILLLATAGMAAAQTGGTISGRVTDETGGVLPGVSVNLQPAAARPQLETVTDGDGRLPLRERAARHRRSSPSG